MISECNLIVGLCVGVLVRVHGGPKIDFCAAKNRLPRNNGFTTELFTEALQPAAGAPPAKKGQTRILMAKCDIIVTKWCKNKLS